MTDSAGGMLPVTSMRPDPRTMLAALLVINTLALSAASLRPTFVAGAIGLIALASTRSWKILAGFAVLEAACLLGLHAAPLLPPGTTGVFLLSVSYWVLRLSVAVSVAVHATQVIQPGELLVAMRSMRLPVSLTVPVVILLRFIPVAIAEIKAVRDAMILRGIDLGLRALVHPLRLLEHFLVPLLASCSRIADEMTAAATLRGFGAHEPRPNSLTVLRPKAADALWFGAVAATLAATDLAGITRILPEAVRAALVVP